MGGDSGDSAPFMDTTDDDDNGYVDEDDHCYYSSLQELSTVGEQGKAK